MTDKVQEAYSFIAQNYCKGDEIFLFGFSRGAYTARMVSGFIGEIGVLNRQDMDHFADIFVTCQKRGNAKTDAERKLCEDALQKHAEVMAKGRARADPDGDGFTIKCLGVFETVGSLGLPSEVTLHSKAAKELFGFPDKILGHHVEHGFQALALNETRKDFTVAKFEQSPKSRRKGQVLKQVWFPGSHADIGGGWRCHDLSDMTLTWMMSNVEPMLAIDKRYLRRLPDPVASWGQQIPHDPAIGIFELAKEQPRQVPTETDDITHEHIHPSALTQLIVLPDVLKNLEANPALLWELNGAEKELKQDWPYVPDQGPADQYVKKEAGSQKAMFKALEKMQAKADEKFGEVIVVDEKGELTTHKSHNPLVAFWHTLTA